MSVVLKLVFLIPFALKVCAVETINPNPKPLPSNSAELVANSKPLDYPADLRAFRTRALQADGVFTPDIAFSVRICPTCKKQYVFGVYPRLTRRPFNALEEIDQSIDEALRKPAPKMMYSSREGRMIPRACPYCGESEKAALPGKVLFCHLIPESGDDLQIEYLLTDGKTIDKTFWRVSRDNKVEKVLLAAPTETEFKKLFGYYFSLRAVWRGIFEAHWDDEQVYYEKVAPGMSFIFRPEKVNDAAFRDYTDKILKPDRDKGLFSRLESPLKTDKEKMSAGTYQDWAGKFAEKLSKGPAECFVGISFPELRSASKDALASRRAALNLAPGKTSVPGIGFVERGALKIPVNLAPLVNFAALGGMSLQQTCSQHLSEATFTLDEAELLGHALQSAMPGCSFDFPEGRYLLAADQDKQERKFDLLTLAGKLNPSDKEMFALFCQHIIRWDSGKERFGEPPNLHEISPVGLPAFVEQRIRPMDFLNMFKPPKTGALFEPLKDAEGKRFDLCYTSECSSTVVYIDISMPRFDAIPDINTARQLYAEQGGRYPQVIDAKDALVFPGGLPGMLECTAAIFFGSDVSSLAADPGRATTLANFGKVQDDTNRIHFYAFTTNSAVLAPRKLSVDEYQLVKSRLTDMLQNSNPGPELNLHFDLQRSKPTGKVLLRKK